MFLSFSTLPAAPYSDCVDGTESQDQGPLFYMGFLGYLLTFLFVTCSHTFELGNLVSSMGNGPTKNFGESAKAIITKEVPSSNSNRQETAIFAAGCFWGVELAFQRVPGVLKTEVGYTGGTTKNPSYEQVCSGQTGHTEAVKVDFNPDAINYDELLTVYWDRLDPTTRNRQGGDVGTQYRSGVYYFSEEQKNKALASRDAEQKKYASPIVTEILPASEWYPAEDYHQKVCLLHSLKTLSPSDIYSFSSLYSALSLT